MSKPIPIACLALLGTAGPALAQSGQISDLATLRIRYEMTM